MRIIATYSLFIFFLTVFTLLLYYSFMLSFCLLLVIALIHSSLLFLFCSLALNLILINAPIRRAIFRVAERNRDAFALFSNFRNDIVQYDLGQCDSIRFGTTRALCQWTKMHRINGYIPSTKTHTYTHTHLPNTPRQIKCKLCIDAPECGCQMLLTHTKK